MGVCFSVARWDIQSSAVTSQEALAGSQTAGGGETPAQADSASREPGQSRRKPEATPLDCYGPVSGQLIAAMKEACRHAFQAQPQRLMAAMYTCEIMATAEVLGKRLESTADALLPMFSAVSVCLQHSLVLV